MGRVDLVVRVVLSRRVGPVASRLERVLVGVPTVGRVVFPRVGRPVLLGGFGSLGLGPVGHRRVAGLPVHPVGFGSRRGLSLGLGMVAGVLDRGLLLRPGMRRLALDRSRATRSRNPGTRNLASRTRNLGSRSRSRGSSSPASLSPVSRGLVRGLGR